MSRIPGTFRRLAKAGEAALVPYLPAGIPSLEVTRRLLPIIGRQGADIIVIGTGSGEAFGGNLSGHPTQATLDGCLSISIEARRSNEVPLVLLASQEDVHAHGIEQLAHDCAAAGIDALLVPDLPLAFAGPLAGACRAAGVDLPLTISAVTGLERLPDLASIAGGFVYCITEDSAGLAELIEHIRARTDLPIIVPSTLGTPDDVAKLSRLADGVLAVRALLPVMQGAEEEVMLDVSDVVRALKEATHRGAPAR